jgi:hypothetical protein
MLSHITKNKLNVTTCDPTDNAIVNLHLELRLLQRLLQLRAQIRQYIRGDFALVEISIRGYHYQILARRPTRPIRKNPGVRRRTHVDEHLGGIVLGRVGYQLEMG